MFQPQPTYLPLSTGYGIGHGLPEYTFQETPLGLSGSGGVGGPGGGGGGPGVGPGSSGVVGGGGGGAGAGGIIGTGRITSGGGGGGYVGIGGGSATVGAAAGGNTGGGGGGGGAVGAGTVGAATTAASALIYTTPIFSPNTGTIGPASGPLFPFHTTSSHHNNQHHHSSSHNRTTRIKMEPNADDLAAQEAAAREYQPQPKGPLVGDKLPSTTITEEYAKGDAVYVEKTIALPQTYSHYRPIQGDGNCGWRAIGFGYFEALINRGDRAQVEAEKLRMEALNNYIEKVGEMSPFVFMDMSEETIELLGRISDALPDRDRAMAELMEAFNTQAVSDSIIYHFRLLASSCLKGNREQYAAFITGDRGLDGYCETTIQQHNREIEHLGVILLVNVLLKPVGFVLEIAYLDRSPGSQVNTYRFPEEANGQDPSALGSMIHLLYRPDHYDILYPVQLDIQVHRMHSFQPSFMASPTVGIPDYGASDLHSLSAIIPNFCAAPPGLATFADAAAGSPLTSYTSSPGSTWTTPLSFTEAAQPQPTPVPVAVPAPAPALQQTYPLRLSEYCQMPEYVENVTSREPAFQTSTFRNSHFNVAHYNNPNFQPEEYKPESEEYDSPPTKGSGRKRGSV